MQKSRKHSPIQSESESILTQVPLERMQEFANQLVKMFPQKSPLTKEELRKKYLRPEYQIPPKQ